MVSSWGWQFLYAANSAHGGLSYDISAATGAAADTMDNHSSCRWVLGHASAIQMWQA